MKTKILLAVVVFAITLSTSCNSDDDGGSEPSIVGTWLLVSGSREEFTNNVSDGTETETIDADNFVRLTFNEDGTFSEFESYSRNVDGEDDVETFTSTGTYSVSENVLSMTYSIDTETFEFTLSETQLVIGYVDEFINFLGEQKRLVSTTTYNRQ